MKTFIETQFWCCPQIWMFHSRGLKRKVNRIHDGALRITFVITSHHHLENCSLKTTLLQYTIETLELWQQKYKML